MPTLSVRPANPSFSTPFLRSTRLLLWSLATALALGLATTAARGQCVGEITTGDVSTCSGNNLTLRATFPITGGTISWRRNGVTLTNGVNANGTTISGATSANLTLTSIAAADAGDYTVRYSLGFPFNCSGTSPAVTVTVDGAPVITNQPDSLTVCEDGTATFSVSATSRAGGTPSFQWWRGTSILTDGPTSGGTMVSGATSSTLRLESVGGVDEGSYTCVINDACSTSPSTTTAAATLAVNSPPDFVVIGSGTASVCAQGTVMLSASGFFGDPRGSFEWRKNGSPLIASPRITGLNSPSLRITDVQADDAGLYSLRVSNPCGSDTGHCQLVVRTPPSVAPLTAVTGCEDSTVSISIEATGSAPLTYAWQRNGIPLVDGLNANATSVTGTQTPTLTLTGADPADTGNYTCLVSNSCGGAFPPAVPVTIRPRTRVTSAPSDSSVCAGLTATFSITATGSGTLSYRWSRNGIDLSNGVSPNGTTVSGAMTATLTLTSVATDDAGTYACRVTGSCGVVTSTSASLVVDSPATITTQPAATAGCIGSTVTLTVAASATGVTTYQWRRGSVSLSNGATPGGTVISGATAATLVLTGVTAADAGSYDCVMSNSCGPVVSSAASVTINAGTVIAAQPQPVATPVGTSASFTVATSGPTPISYRWQRNNVILNDGTDASGTTISGATTASLSLSTVSSDAAGNYRCIITAPCSTLNSSAAALVPFTDLGTASENTLTHTASLVSRGVIWVRFTTTQDAVNPDRFLDLHTVGSLLNSGNTQDTEIGLYTSTGTLITENDDVGGSFGFSRLSFGQASPDRPYPPLTIDAAGQNGLLPAGTHYAAAAAYNMSFGSTGFDIATASTKTGTIVINIISGTAVAPCVSDLNTDGTIDGSDFIDFINSFGIGDAAVDPLADIVDGGGTPPGDGTIDGSDFIAFINAFAAGC